MGVRRMKQRPGRPAHRSPPPLVFGAISLLLPAGCSYLGGPLVDVPPPDEFQVIAYEPLVIPSHLDQLPPPRPGAPSPRRPDPHRLATSALTGASGSPVVAEQPPSAGEQVLLSSANAAAASSEVRSQIEQETRAEKANKPYEPPSLGELLGLTSKRNQVAKGEVIEPESEAERLLSQGKPAPVDPNAAAKKKAAEEAAKGPEPVEPSYPTRGGPPPSPIVGKKSTPAY